MRLITLVIILLLVSCSRMPVREVASIENDYFFGEVDFKRSSVRQFPPEREEGLFRYYFYVQLKDSWGGYIDIEPSDISLRNKRGKKIPFHVERVLRGRYYITIESTSEFKVEEVDFFLSGKLLREQFQLLLNQPHKKYSSVKILSSEKNKLRLQLQLKDAKGRTVQVPTTPDLIIEGHAFIENYEQVGDGRWEFDLYYPEQNEIFYISIRAHGTFLERIFRFQHIEK